MMRAVTLSLVVATSMFAVAGHAQAWEPFRSPNGHVETGNAALKKNDAKGALASYDKAARELPSAAGVHLDRGLALLAQGDLQKARTALLMATEPPATDEVRAAAYYNMGLAFYREGDASAQKDQHEPAQASFRQAVDALKRSLRAMPGNRDAAWNLELANRRVQDEEKKQQEQQKKDQQKKDQDKQNDPKQEPQPQDQNDKDKQDQKQDQPQDQKDQPPKDQQKQDQPQQPNQDQNGENPKPDDQGQQNQPKEQPGEQQQPQGQPLPDQVRKALDALQESEENFEQKRAQVRARRENRRVLKDW